MAGKFAKKGEPQCEARLNGRSRCERPRGHLGDHETSLFQWKQDPPLQCARCGMGIGPVLEGGASFHEDRYAHKPVIRRAGKLFEFDDRTYSFSHELQEV